MVTMLKKISVQCGRELNFIHSDITVIILHGQILILYNWRPYLSITPRILLITVLQILKITYFNFSDSLVRTCEWWFVAPRHSYTSQILSNSNLEFERPVSDTTWQAMRSRDKAKSRLNHRYHASVCFFCWVLIFLEQGMSTQGNNHLKHFNYTKQ